MKKTIKKTITEVITYSLTKELKYVRTVVNGEIKGNYLQYTGKNIEGYPISPMYDVDLSILSKWNPFWGKNKELEVDGYEWLDKILPSPETVYENLDKISYGQRSTHEFFDVEKKRIPVVVQGDYIGENINNAYFKIDELREHFINHPNIVYCSEVLDVPYYNRGDSSGTKYLKVLALPSKEFANRELPKGSYNRKSVFYKYDSGDETDFLGMKPFLKDKPYSWTDDHDYDEEDD